MAQANAGAHNIEVNSHTGVQGNEAAEHLANETREAACCRETVTLGPGAFSGYALAASHSNSTALASKIAVDLPCSQLGHLLNASSVPWVP